jgi:type VI secretion system secreted protein Hcp
MEQIFLKPNGITGASTSSHGTGEIEILSYSYGVSMPVTHSVAEGQRTHGQANVQDLSISKYVDVTTPIFLQHCCKGTIITTMTLRHLRADTAGEAAEHLLTIDLNDVLVTSVSASGSDQPMENITFNFSKIQWTYHKQDKTAAGKGQVVASYDIALNKVA